MPPGGETFRLSPRFGENVLHHGSHEWLPYSKDEVHLKSSNTNLSVCRVGGPYGKEIRNESMCDLLRGAL